MPKFFVIIAISLTLGGNFVSGQVISATSIARAIQNDTGSSMENYLDYAAGLASTLGLLTSEQLSRVFEGNLVVEGGGVNNEPVPVSLNEALGLENVEFRFGSSRLADSATAQLDKVAEFLLENPNSSIQIEGHVSLDFSQAQELSEGRAEVAKDYLVEAGLDPDRIITVGSGFSDPLVSGEGRRGGSANRRIEFTLIE